MTTSTVIFILVIIGIIVLFIVALTTTPFVIQRFINKNTFENKNL